MSVYRHMGPLDFLRLNVTSADHYSGEKGFASLLNYTMLFRNCCFVVEQPHTVVGKAEGQNINRRGLLFSAASLMMARETHMTDLFRKFQIACEWSRCYYIHSAVRAFKREDKHPLDTLGYIMFQRITGFYADGGDAFDMRLSLLRDVDRVYSIPAKPRVISHDAWLKSDERLGTPKATPKVGQCCSDCLDCIDSKSKK